MNEEINEVYLKTEEKLFNHEIYQNVKDYSKTKEKMRTYLEVAMLISSVEPKYVKGVIVEFSKRLSTSYEEFSNSK